MNHAALFCHVDPSREADRLSLRDEHLAYMQAHRDRILFGGPTLSDSGAPETMVVVLAATSIADARAFIDIEPYTAHGIFSHVDIREWVKVLPE